MKVDARIPLTSRDESYAWKSKASRKHGALGDRFRLYSIHRLKATEDRTRSCGSLGGAGCSSVNSFIGLNCVFSSVFFGFLLLTNRFGTQANPMMVLVSIDV